MQLSSIFHAVPDATKDGIELTRENFRPGDRLLGRIVRLEADGRALIDLGGFRAKAQLGFPVQPGQTLNLHVVQSGFPLHLQADVKGSTQAPAVLPQLNFTSVLSADDQQQLISVLDGMTQSAKTVSLSHQIPGRLELAMNQIRALFGPIPTDKSIPQLMKWLKGAMENRGVLFEKKLADAIETGGRPSEGAQASKTTDRVRSVITSDLKPQLLVLKSAFEGNALQKLLPETVSKNEIEFMRNSIEKLLHHVVQQQERAASNWRDGDSFQVFTHILPTEDPQSPVQIKVHYPKKRGDPKGGSQQRIALLLQMDRLGQVRADLAMTGRQLKIQIFVQNDDVRQLIDLNSMAVSQALKGVFEEVVVVTAVSEKKIALFNQPGRHGTSLGRIDIQA